MVMLRRIVIVICGLALMSLGITLYLTCGLGADPVTLLLEGLAHVTKLSVGRVSQVLMLIILAGVYFVAGRKPGLGTLLNAVLIGVFIDGYLATNLFQTSGLFMSVVMLGFAALSLGVGVGLYVSAGLGEGAIEALMMALHETTGVRLKWVRIGMDLTAVTVGSALGASIGIGTLVGALATGPIAEWVIRAARALERAGRFPASP